MSNDKLNSKNYAKKGMISMTFGSIMNSLQGTMDKDWEARVQRAWELAEKLTSDHIEKLYDDNNTEDQPL